jgi:hypothetical protein
MDALISFRVPWIYRFFDYWISSQIISYLHLCFYLFFSTNRSDKWVLYFEFEKAKPNKGKKFEI